MTDYERLEKIILDAYKLVAEDARSSGAKFEAWHTRAQRFLLQKYGKDSLEYKKFDDTYFTFGVYVDDQDEYDRLSKNACKEGLETTIAIFETYLEELKEESDENHTVKKVVQLKNLSKIFIVHGHDEALKQEVARLIEKQNIEAIILSEKANKGKTIIEKLEENSDVGCAICLFTPDDAGKANKETDYKARARQNVVLEAGFFMGKLGREHVVYIAKDGLEMPSDLQGVVYTNATNWQVDLLKELKEMGYKVDFNKLF